MVNIIDTHSHLTFSAFNKDRDEVIGRMKEQGIGAIDVGTTIETSRAAVELAQNYDFIWAAVGIHPTETSADFSVNEFKELAKNSRVAAIGECGLDYYHKPYDEAAQKDLFKKHIELAQEKDLPLIVHCRPSAGTQDAYDDLRVFLQEHPGLRGTVHFFAGDLEHAQKFIELGFLISFSGVITFAQEYESLVADLPLDKILIETDSPYAAPAPYRGKRNEPSYVVEVAKKIAEAKGVSLDEVADQTTKNAKQLFNI